MAAVLDHIFVCTAPGAPAASRLIDFGLREGTPNRHPGQGTANRRFFFHNAMLELLYVENAAEAHSAQARSLGLWPRLSPEASNACPFGIILRPAEDSQPEPPFPAWEYRPPTMPDLVLHIATSTLLTEPFWAYAPAGLAPIHWPPERRQIVDHPRSLQDITAVTISGPPLPAASVTRSIAATGLLTWREAPGYSLELEFDNTPRKQHTSFHGDLPLTLRW